MHRTNILQNIIDSTHHSYFILFDGRSLHQINVIGGTMKKKVNSDRSCSTMSFIKHRDTFSKNLKSETTKTEQEKELFTQLSQTKLLNTQSLTQKRNSGIVYIILAIKCTISNMTKIANIVSKLYVSLRQRIRSLLCNGSTSNLCGLYRWTKDSVNPLN